MELKAGVFPHYTNEQYHESEAVGRSHLHALRTVPAGAKVEKKDTGAMGLGTACHLYILEPHLFDAQVIETGCKTSTAKEFTRTVEENPGKCIVTAGTIEAVEQICASVWKHPAAAALLGDPDLIAEPTILWQDEGTGIWCKTRPDGIIPSRRVFLDLKFVAKGKADMRKFLWSIRDYGYDLQAAGNILGMKRATGVLYTEFWFIVCETEAPYRTAVYQLDEDWLGDAMWEWQNLLQIEAKCRAAGEWPNYVADNAEGETIYRGI